ncbi:MAG TPA: hypothetical protein IAB61_12370 [Candidatus Merdisoma merdipullorum]|nr:hypothetical protein [Candidatus Merdisoma merdipullorum]
MRDAVKGYYISFPGVLPYNTVRLTARRFEKDLEKRDLQAESTGTSYRKKQQKRPG